MHNITALENAGFKERNQISPDFEIINGDISVSVNPKSLSIKVYLNHQTLIQKHLGKNLEDVKAFCYGHLGYHLNFTAKPKYDWETVKAKLSKDNLELYTAAANALHRLYTYKVIDKLEAQSMIAKLKLNIIIQQIDKDCPKELPNFTGVLYIEGEKINAGHVHNEQAWQYRINTTTVQGAKILLDQNPQLLQNLFKIETDA